MNPRFIAEQFSRNTLYFLSLKNKQISKAKTGILFVFLYSILVQSNLIQRILVLYFYILFMSSMYDGIFVRKYHTTVTKKEQSSLTDQTHSITNNKSIKYTD